MIRRSTKILFELVLALVAVAVVLAGVAAWRLSQGPQQINFLTRYLEQAITPADSELVLTIDKTVLLWSAEDQALDLRALGVRLTDREGETVALLPWVSVGLSPRALLRGVIAPREIEIYGARLTLYQDPLTGDVSLSGGDWAEVIDLEPVPEAAAEETDLSAVLPRILKVLVSPPGPEQPLSYLQAVRFRNGRVIVVSGTATSVWRIPFQRAELRRDRLGLKGVVDLPSAQDGQWDALSLEITYIARHGRTIVLARVRDMQPDVISRLVPDASLLSSLRMPLSGGVEAIFEQDGQLTRFGFNLEGKSGRLEVPELLSAPLPILGLRLDGSWEPLVPPRGRLNGEIRIGEEGAAGPIVSFLGLMNDKIGSQTLDISVKVSDLTARDLRRYWPAALKPDARDWVTENITDGLVEQFEATASLKLPSEGFEDLEVVSLAGTFGYRGVAAHYYRPLPPVVGLSGSARFDLSSLSLEAGGGWLEDVQIGRGKVDIVNLDRDDEAIFIEVEGKGPISTVLRVLDWESLRLVSDLGLDPVGVAGEGSIVTHFSFPLLQDLEVSQIKYDAQAKLTGAAMNDVVFGWSVAGGDMDLSVDPVALRIAGTADLEGLPITFQWRERLADAAGAKTAIEVASRSATHADLAALGLEFEAYAKGPLVAEVSVRIFDDDDGTLSATVDLSRSALEVPELHWAKPAGSFAKLRFSSAFSHQGIVDLKAIELRGEDLLVSGRARLDAEAQRLIWLDLDQVRFGRNRLTGLQANVKGETLNLRVGGAVLDLQPYLVESAAEPGEGLEAGAKAWADLGLVADNLERVILDDGRYLENVSLVLNRDRKGWQRILLEGRVPEAFWRAQPGDRETGAEDAGLGQSSRRAGVDEEVHPEVEQQASDTEAQASDAGSAQQVNSFSLDFGPSEDGDYRLKLTADDFGSLLRATGHKDPIVGGRVDVTGRSDGPLPGSTIYGQVEMTDYTLIEAPFLAKILTIASLTGLWDTLQGRGIHFERLTGEFALTDGLLRSDLIRAYGPALGLTTKGEVDFYEDFLKISGTVVPAYTINSILGEIPGLGPLLVGGEGEGLLAITYEAEGPIEDPEVDVNALSVLAPGFLRGLFNDFGGYQGDQPTVFPTEPDK